MWNLIKDGAIVSIIVIVPAAVMSGCVWGLYLGLQTLFAAFGWTGSFANWQSFNVALVVVFAVTYALLRLTYYVPLSMRPARSARSAMPLSPSEAIESRYQIDVPQRPGGPPQNTAGSDNVTRIIAELGEMLRGNKGK